MSDTYKIIRRSLGLDHVILVSPAGAKIGTDGLKYYHLSDDEIKEITEQDVISYFRHVELFVPIQEETFQDTGSLVSFVKKERNEFWIKEVKKVIANPETSEEIKKECQKALAELCLEREQLG